jgi:hypothetical protein
MTMYVKLCRSVVVVKIIFNVNIFPNQGTTRKNLIDNLVHTNLFFTYCSFTSVVNWLHQTTVSV